MRFYALIGKDLSYKISYQKEKGFFAKRKYIITLKLRKKSSGKDGENRYCLKHCETNNSSCKVETNRIFVILTLYTKHIFCKNFTH